MNHEDAKGTKDLLLYLIGVTDQVKHHALTGKQPYFTFITPSIENNPSDHIRDK